MLINRLSTNRAPRSSSSSFPLVPTGIFGRVRSLAIKPVRILLGIDTTKTCLELLSKASGALPGSVLSMTKALLEMIMIVMIVEVRTSPGFTP